MTDATSPQTADRADELAKHVTRAIFALKSPAPPGSEHYRSGWDDGLEAAIGAARDAVLRRVADEAQAHPAEHTWAAELYDPLAEEWVPGTRYFIRDRAVNALTHARSIGPTWRDGTPTERRLVRATTTYTVETPAAAPVAGQPPADTTREEADRIVAYRAPVTDHLFCAPCGQSDRSTPLTSDDLPDGGVCVGCGVDVLITQEF